MAEKEHDYTSDGGDNHTVPYDDYYDSQDEEEYDESDDFNTEHACDFLGSHKAPCIRWQRIKVGDAVLEVSSNGEIRPYNYEFQLGVPIATFGCVLPGTPYRTYTVQVHPNEFKTFFVHDMVYTAFNGKPPDGYEVRHVPEYTMKARKAYSNRLGCLMIYPKTVSPFSVGPQ